LNHFYKRIAKKIRKEHTLELLEGKNQVDL